MQIITLSNGKRVANFSSPHPFVFTDGSILPGVSERDALWYAVTFIEDDLGNGDIKLTFDITDAIWNLMIRWNEAWGAKEVDVVFCPLPMIIALHNWGYNVRNSPFRCIRIEDRINKLVSIDKQTL